MSGTPVLIVLYDTDAVEVRCSDGSRLELSPCGATMIYQPPLRKGDHPRHGVSSRVHKRTCFVTSDHKKLVLQTLDFRNRFAQRPYLCEELLNKDDVLTLYASVDSIRWPDSFTSSNVEILADGSRKITSLDDFASLVVSPHGQDFSISYLSRISFDDKGKNSSTQFLQSSNVSYCLSRNRSELSSNFVDGKSSSEKNREAIVQPFQLLSIENEKNFVSSTSASAASDDGKKNPANSKEQFDHGIAVGVDANKSLSNSSDLDKTLVGEATPRLEDVRLQNPYAQSDNRDDVDQCLANVSGADSNSNHPHPNQNQDESGSIIIPGSPVAHDISSISRSSTPDGLRTTIDSDATLIHDHYEMDALSCQRMLYTHHHRHSSPTHCSSPLDDLRHLSFEAGGSGQGKKNANNLPNSVPSLDGSYLEHQRHSPVGVDENKTSHNNDACYNKMDDKITSHSTHDNKNTNANTSGSNPPALNSNLQNQKQMMDPLKSENNKVSMHEEDTPVETSSSLDPLVAKKHNDIVNISGYDKLQNETKHPNYDELTRGKNQRSAADFRDTRGISEISKTDVNIKSNSNAGPMAHTMHQESHSKSSHSQSQHSPRMLSSVIESDAEDESVCRKKYVWVTTNASRNCCPREWIHPLSLALKAESEKKAPSVKERQKQSPVPKPLPLTCPFQHKHRMSHSRHSQEEEAEGSSQSGSGKKREDVDSFTSSIREFQQGRLKVVVSEGIIYRLTSCNEMTVVEVYPGDGTVLVSQGVKAVFFTHIIPRTNILEERTYSLKSLPPGCAKGRHSIERMMKTANRLAQICLNWDKRCGKGKPPCWQKEIVAVVEPLSSSLLEECCVSGLGRFSAFTNGRVRVLFDDRTALDTVADFKPRLGNVTEIHQSAFFQSESGASTARLLVTSGNYVTVEMNRPGPYAKYTSAAKEWIAWVNATQGERQEFYRHQNQPHVIQQAAELELRKIFCFNYILEHTAALSTQPNQVADPQADTAATANTTTCHNMAGDTHHHNHHQHHHHHHHHLNRHNNDSNNDSDIHIKSSSIPLPPKSIPTLTPSSHSHSSNSKSASLPYYNNSYQHQHHHLHHKHHHHQTPHHSIPSSSIPYNNRSVPPPPPTYLPSTQTSSHHPTHPSSSSSSTIPLPSQYNNHNPLHPSGSTSSTPLHPPTSYTHTHTQYNNNPLTTPRSQSTPFHNNNNTIPNTKQFIHSNTQQQRIPFHNPNTQHIPSPHYTRHTPTVSHHHDDRCVDTSMGFQSVRSNIRMLKLTSTGGGGGGGGGG